MFCQKLKNIVTGCFILRSLFVIMKDMFFSCMRCFFNLLQRDIYAVQTGQSASTDPAINYIIACSYTNLPSQARVHVITYTM